MPLTDRAAFEKNGKKNVEFERRGSQKKGMVQYAGNGKRIQDFHVGEDKDKEI